MSRSAGYLQRLTRVIEARLRVLPAPASDCAHVWQLDCRSVPENDGGFLAVLCSRERARALAFRLEHEAVAFGIAHAALRALLGAYLDRSPRDVEFVYGAFGKPHIAPQGQVDSLEFNMAHSGGRILIAVTRGRAIGIDVERHRPITRIESVARAIYTRDEEKSWSAMNERRRVHACFRSWVRKEAMLKARGCGLTMRPSSIAVPLTESEPLAPVSLVARDGERSWWLSDVGERRGWSAALALEGAAEPNIVHKSLDDAATAPCASGISLAATGSAGA